MKISISPLEMLSLPVGSGDCREEYLIGPWRNETHWDPDSFLGLIQPVAGDMRRASRRREVGLGRDDQVLAES